MKNTPLYLDYNATAPMLNAVREVMSNIMVQPYNASSVHAHGRTARKIVEEARTQVAGLVNIPPAQLIFNSGATEGNNTVLKYFSGERVLVSAIEHPSVLEAAPHAEKIPVTADGVVDLDALERMLKSQGPSSTYAKASADKPQPSPGGRGGLVSVMMVNNETGVIQPVKEISALAKRHGALFHSDAVQAAGRIAIDMQEMGIDFLTLSAHKIGGPQGVGALALGLCGITPVLLEGGGQEKKARAGTENVAGIAGFGAAAKAVDIAGYQKKLGVLRDRLEDVVAGAQGVTVHGVNAPRVANTSLFSIAGMKSETMLMAFDLEGICLSNGSACTSGTVKPSHVLQAMGTDGGGSLRVSMGPDTTAADVERFLEVWSKIAERRQKKVASHG